MSGKGPSSLLWRAAGFVVGLYLVAWLLVAVVQMLQPLVPWIVAGLLVGIGLRAWRWQRNRW